MTDQEKETSTRCDTDQGKALAMDKKHPKEEKRKCKKCKVEFWSVYSLLCRSCFMVERGGRFDD